MTISWSNSAFLSIDSSSIISDQTYSLFQDFSLHSPDSFIGLILTSLWVLAALLQISLTGFMIWGFPAGFWVGVQRGENHWLLVIFMKGCYYWVKHFWWVEASCTFRNSLGLCPRELLQAKGYIWQYIPCLVLIRIQYVLYKKDSRNYIRLRKKKLYYTELFMVEYSSPVDLDISSDEKNWVFKTRKDDTDLTTNGVWLKEDNKWIKQIY